MAKQWALSSWRAFGGLRLVANSKWRSERLAILCYHGVSLDDEHHWDPALYVTQEHLKRRLELLNDGGYQVLPLEEGLKRLSDRMLPPRAVSITFDDGPYDFSARAWPILRQYGYPATVYLTTYYSDYPQPVFPGMCSYLLWRARNRRLQAGRVIEVPESWDLSQPRQRQELLALIQAKALHMNGAKKDELLVQVAEQAGEDLELLRKQRKLQLLRPDEVRVLSGEGVDFQLHTHRHQTPMEETLFRQEIRQNKERIEAMTGKPAVDFCYPSGVHNSAFLPWLREEGVRSGTTCESGLANPNHSPLLLPRVIDHGGLSELEFCSWLAGIGGGFAPRVGRI